MYPYGAADIYNLEWLTRIGAGLVGTKRLPRPLGMHVWFTPLNIREKYVKSYVYNITL
jgi:hypothetical protein